MTVTDFDPAELPPPDPQRFTIENDEGATWAMRKLKAIRDKRAEIIRIAEAEIARVQEWAGAETEGLDHDDAFFEGLLTVYAAKQRNTENRKSISTPYGMVTSRAGSKTTEVDPDKFLPWALANNASLVKEEVKRTPIKAAITAAYKVLDDGVVVTPDGEAVPGVRVHTGDTKYTVQVAK